MKKLKEMTTSADVAVDIVPAKTNFNKKLFKRIIEKIRKLRK